MQDISPKFVRQQPQDRGRPAKADDKTAYIMAEMPAGLAFSAVCAMSAGSVTYATD
jgi:hypothetical protein